MDMPLQTSSDEPPPNNIGTTQQRYPIISDTWITHSQGRPIRQPRSLTNRRTQQAELRHKKEDLERKAVALRGENKQLTVRQETMIALASHQEDLLYAIRQASAASSLGLPGCMPLTGGVELAETVMNRMFSDGYVPDDNWIR